MSKGSLKRSDDNQPGETQVIIARELPYVKDIRKLAITSLILIGPLGMGIAAQTLNLANQTLKKYQENSGDYTSESLEKVKKGKRLAKVGLILSIIANLILLFILID